MTSHDSGVDTSNDSCYTNDNSNSANNSFISLSSPSRESIQLRLPEPKVMSLIALPPATSSDYLSQRAQTHEDETENCTFGKMSLPKRKLRKTHYPYVCKVPKERKLRWAASVCNTELLERLLEEGVDPNAADEHLRSPLHLAASRGYRDVVKLLLIHGANPNQQDSLGNTPLHLAVCCASSYNFNMVARILLHHGARVNILDRTGKTPLNLARSKLLLMRTRLGSGTTPESAKLFIEMSMLTGLLNKQLTKQLKDMEDFDDLEARLRNLTTKEIEAGADNLLTDVAGLTLN